MEMYMNLYAAVQRRRFPSIAAFVGRCFRLFLRPAPSERHGGSAHRMAPLTYATAATFFARSLATHRLADNIFIVSSTTASDVAYEP
eukprot:747652-Pleurochrysis_carterae.AAC.4